MRYVFLGILALLACDAPTDTKSAEAPTSIDGLRVVHPAFVIVTVTPGDTSAYPAGTVQYKATARDDQGRLLRASSWKWSSSDTTIATVSPTGLATARSVGRGIISAIAYPPWRRL
jgi:hypothetical protein